MRFLILALTLVAPVMAQNPGEAGRAGGKAQAQTKREATTYRGVVDQKESDFVLANPDTMEPIATLRGQGFDKENFARFVGVPVEVRGSLVTENGVKILNVRRIDDIKPVPVKPEKD